MCAADVFSFFLFLFCFYTRTHIHDMCAADVFPQDEGEEGDQSYACGLQNLMGVLRGIRSICV